MVVIDWLQTCEFIRENSERFILYSLCGGFIGIILILMMIIIILYIKKHLDMKNNSQSPRTDFEYDDTRSYLPVYRYNGRTHDDLYHI